MKPLNFKEEPPKPKVLVFPDEPAKPPSKSVPRSIFDVENKYEQHIQRAINYATDNFQTLRADFPSIERQIRQLFPIRIDVIGLWGSSALDQESQLTSEIAILIKQQSSMGANEALEDVTRCLSKRESFMDKFFARNVSVESLRPRLKILKQQIEQLLPRYKNFIEQANKSETRLLIHLSSLVAALDAAGQLNDDLARVSADRRNILQQAAVQAKLALLQLSESRKILVSQVARIDQLLTITLPAYEMTSHN
jgi:hypothetical protein